MPVTTPPLIPQPFAQNGLRAAIPNTTVSPGRASFDQGFPAITMQAKVAGGIPPDGRDVNGVLYDVSAVAQYVQAGQPFKYDASVSAAVSGYGVGAILQSTDGETLWLNQTNGNTTDPDAGGAGWTPYLSYGAAVISGLTGGAVRTLTAAESRFPLILLSGALTANQAVVFPATLQQWRIVNTCTGAFSVTARTAGGTGVTVPAGGYAASTPVYGNGTDIFFDVPPVSIPSDVNPTPNTLAMRNNAGDGFFRYLNMGSAIEAFAASAIFAMAGIDGYLRKLDLATFLAQIFDSVTLTGTGVTTTPTVGNNTTRIANTTYVQNNMLGGAGQSWQVMSPRALFTTYTNTTGRPIQANILCSIGGAGGAYLLVNGINVDQAYANDSDNFTLSATIPAGATYRVNTFSGSIGLISWVELR